MSTDKEIREDINRQLDALAREFGRTHDQQVLRKLAELSA